METREDIQQIFLPEVSRVFEVMGILKGKDSALSHIDQSKTAFLATLSEVEQGPSTHTMPPKDHYTLKFTRETIKNLKGRVYETMKQYAYEQRGQISSLEDNDQNNLLVF